MKNADFLNDLAIRASYGIQGNVHPDQTPNLIASLGTLEALPQEYVSTLHKLPNNKLKWEKTRSYNIAIDWAFWNNRRRSGSYEECSSFYGSDERIHQ